VRPLAVVVAVAGIVLTAVLTWTASAVNHSSNSRLLQLQVRQTAAALSSALPSIQSQLVDAVQVAAATSGTAAFKRFVSEKVGSQGPYLSVSLWKRTGNATTLVAIAGPTPLLVSDGGASAFFSHVHPSAQLQVTGILKGTPPRLGYAEMPPGDTILVVYAESLLPANHRLVLPKSSPFSDLNVALYLGPGAHASQLMEASVPTPVRGPTAASTVAFGDSAITVVGTPKTDLAGGLSAALPWIALGIGLVLTLASASTLEYVTRRRQLAEHLAEENESLYLEQRNIAGTLQQALLPEVTEMDGIEAAARYLPGAAGVDVGGDWYDIICPEKDRCVLVVGDVSGRGLKAATTMAALRYATRAYVVEGHDPQTVLTKLGDMLDFESQHQFATVLIADIDVPRRCMTLASAGHFPPLLVSLEGIQFVDLAVSTPVGVDAASQPTPASVQLSSDATFIAFTDGLIERRGEHLDVSLERLRAAAAGQTGSLEELLDHLAETLIPTGAEDDVVILGFRWRN
jgi:serine phosphatase RsbU (regulator of sigma subunit)